MFPVEKIIPAIRESLERNRDVVLRAPPGSGKTTCVPPALLDAPFLRGKKIRFWTGAEQVEVTEAWLEAPRSGMNKDGMKEILGR